MSTITDAIKKDHRELVEYYNNILHAPDDDTATRWQNQFTWELCRYLVAKELIVYPAFEKNLGEKGRIITDKNRSEHQRVSTFSSYTAGFIFKLKIMRQTDKGEAQ
jgi:hemerythrin superfamily protein